MKHIQLHKHTIQIPNVLLYVLTAVLALTAFTLIKSTTAKAEIEGCEMYDPTVVVMSSEKQYGTPGSTLYYHLNITNNDSVACGPSSFAVNLSTSEPNWVFGGQSTETIDPTEYIGYSTWATSPADSYNGEYQILINLVRQNGIPTTVSVPITYVVIGGQDAPDTIAPTVNIVSPTTGSTVKKGGNILITAIATDNVAVQRLEFYVNNVLVCSGTSQQCRWRAPNTRATHTITVKAFDTSNNSSSSSIVVTTR